MGIDKIDKAIIFARQHYFNKLFNKCRDSNVYRL